MLNRPTFGVFIDHFRCRRGGGEKTGKGLAAVLFLFGILLGTSCFAEGSRMFCGAGSADRRDTVRLVLFFTGDIHSEVLPEEVSPDESAALESFSYKRHASAEDSVRDAVPVLRGGFSRLAETLFRERERYRPDPKACILTVDAGDAVMGTVFQSILREEAVEYNLLHLLGYDAWILGNHDFDFGPSAVAKMLERVPGRGTDPLLLTANLRLNRKFCRADAASDRVSEASGSGGAGLLDSLLAGAEKSGFRIIEKNGIRIGLFGLMGREAYSVITCKDSLILTDPYVAAGRILERMKSEHPDFIVAVSHGGTLPSGGAFSVRGGTDRSSSPDGRLARRFPEIDIIISGHDHEALSDPVRVDSTWIVSCGAFNRYAGKVILSRSGESGRVWLEDYGLLPLSGSGTGDTAVLNRIASAKRSVEHRFVRDQACSPFDTLAFLSEGFGLALSGENDLPLGSLIAAAYREAAENYLMAAGGEREKEPVVAVVPYGTIRRPLHAGFLVYKDLFSVLSLGEEPDGSAGYPLVLAWIFGKDLRDLCELNATVAPGMPDARLFFAGMDFRYNPLKLPFTRVTQVSVAGEPLEHGRLYPVVTDLYTVRLMGLLRSSSFGILSVEPRTAGGEPVPELSRQIIGKKAWVALAEYLQRTPQSLLETAPSSLAEPERRVWLLYGAVLLLAGGAGKTLYRRCKSVRKRAEKRIIPK